MDITTAHTSHYLHSSDRIWPVSNCYVDLWIEVLHFLGLDPVPALAFTVNLDDEGDQFTFFKFPTSDIEDLYGLKTCELSIYDNLERHIELQVKRNNIVLVEVDGFYLPDTVGVSYQILHTKTTIGIDTIDIKNEKIGYYHNNIYGFLEGEDYKKIIQLKDRSTGQLFPYTEFIKTSQKKDNLPVQRLMRISRQKLFEYLTSYSSNPIAAFRERYLAQISLLNSESFHEYAFNNFRMLGSNFELLGSYLEWVLPLNKATKAISSCKTIATNAKTLQLKTARMVMRKKFDPCSEIFDELELAYSNLFHELNIHCFDPTFLLGSE